VPPFSRGHVITRLGHNIDLILRESYLAVHVAFEIYPETLVVMLSIWMKRVLSVKIKKDKEDKQGGEGRDAVGEGQAILGDCTILYRGKYTILITSYKFHLVWQYPEGLDKVQQVKFLKDLTIKGYEDAMRWLKDVRLRNVSIPESENASSTANSWYMTRLQSAKALLVRELEGFPRVAIRKGGFGTVYKTIDQVSGNYFAVKEVNLKRQVQEGMDLEEA
jgi:hypothetical protein